MRLTDMRLTEAKYKKNLTKKGKITKKSIVWWRQIESKT